jgi:5'-nucleotidase
VVPKFEQSGKSHSIEIHKPFEAKQIALADDVTIWAVDSTPADCVRFACSGLKLSFDLVISGVNRGLNLGHDTMYSGTFAAACEAVNNGINAVALSTSVKYYDHATDHLDDIFSFLKNNRMLELNNLYNVNIPADPKGIRITRQGGPYFIEEFQAMENDMYCSVGKPIQVISTDLTLDTVAHRHGYISISPMTTDRTNWEIFHTLEKVNP